MDKKKNQIPTERPVNLVASMRLASIHYNELIETARKHESNIKIKNLTSTLLTSVNRYEQQLQLKMIDNNPVPVDESYWDKIAEGASVLAEEIQLEKDKLESILRDKFKIGVSIFAIITTLLGIWVAYLKKENSSLKENNSQLTTENIELKTARDDVMKTLMQMKADALKGSSPASDLHIKNK